jgi:uncharacterized protein DUF2867
VPVLTPKLSSLWLKLVTPVYAKVGRALIEGVRNPTVVNDPAAADSLGLKPMGLSQALSKAQNSKQLWKSDTRTRQVSCPAEKAFEPIRRIGGNTGWYFINWLWRLRAALDRMIGGCGMRKGRPDPENLSEGDQVDFWRVERFVPGHLLRLKAEMKMPGHGWLEFEVAPNEAGSIIKQTAWFDPRGMLGRLYWYAVLPFHKLIFRGLLKRIAARAERGHQDSS